MCPFIAEETDAREIKLLAEAIQSVRVEVGFELRQSELIVYTLVRYASTALYAENRTVKHLVLHRVILCTDTILKCLKKCLGKSSSIMGCC